MNGRLNLVDRFGRNHDYLRISVTDRCNLRCHYCVPEGQHQCMDFPKLLTDEEIVQIVNVGAKLGIKKIRITGGEPLLRKNLPELISQIKSIPTIEDIALTTNGVFLKKYGKELKEAGLDRVNISLDSLDEKKFSYITRDGHLNDVLEGIQTSVELGFNPIKINVVLMKDFNVDEIKDFLLWTIREPINIRFIEYMPIGQTNNVWSNQYQSLEIVKEIAERIGQYNPVTTHKNSGPADQYAFENAKGTFGLIHPISCNFCDNCNRLRLTADGHLKPCLFWQDEVSLRQFIDNEQQLIHAFKKAIFIKPERHQMGDENFDFGNPTTRVMSAIGG
ncbi:GTP 3',8-cyclase MoaA [Schinkia azotoformans]|uniref:GTP 3',8-cyclase MoaA n=1 Tax=Schinkia azotoformans TaxID=1454 RepID=UPI002DBFF6C7|nr:GTP 3',8-cyclase MoaA [Schinkia azotoformans]MEC1715774.1 GTP 3',8-cyclase MoaA [Schinkia azotoformans]MEC1741413.1 GTP 3',8-cyclase MoaA [Schinkia azotoformans]MEC1744407.1 GTP 3',8-cyclase MoaA [Schinkia azotoformans]MEC1758602.1 GTP 3',8-cyclase MoaA [Schinkia azotoformans]MEC1765404.1 GTP 3',8-cyclase MoaA [Schinkia azotoformans]